LTWTQYPIKYGGPPREIFEKAEKFGVLLSYAVDSNYTADKESWEMKVQTNGKKSHPWDYALCFMHNDCITMYNGKLYTCHRNIMWEHCDSKFGMQSHVCADDGLDIFRANAGEELLRFVSFRPKLCDYCRVRDFRCVGAWQASGRGKNEWIFDGTEATQEC
jgi:hypothetical protein